ncbi:MAG: efflux RND transporter periplasmic adaptor subunit [Balneolaceae bacterium]
MLRTKPLILLLTVFCISLFSNCAGDSQSQPAEETETANAIPVEAREAIRGDVSAYYTGTATLEAEEEAHAITNVRGVIRRIYVEEGDAVEAGQVLAQLEEEQLQIEVNRAKATMDRLYNDFSRNRDLFERNLISAEAYDNSRFEYETQKANYELASLNLERSAIRSPISGIITDRMVKTGNLVNTNEQLFKIANFDPLLAMLHVPEHEMKKMQKGQKVFLRADALPDTDFEGEVLRIRPVINAQTGTFRVTVAVSDPAGQLKPGMFSRIRVVYDTRYNTLILPKEAVITEDINQSVFLLRENIAFKQPVKTGYVNGQNIEILEGINEGDLVVTIGQNSLRDSSLVEVIQPLAGN